jgi:hypothetical protein
LLLARGGEEQGGGCGGEVFDGFHVFQFIGFLLLHALSAE